MAKITTSSLVTGMHGKLKGSVLRTTKKGVTISKGYAPRDAQSEEQMNSRRLLNGLTTSWSNLTPTEKSLWDKFSSQSKGEPTGFHAFLELNLNLLNSGNPSLTLQTTPPTLPLTPPAVTGFYADEIGNTTSLIGWITPNDASIFVKTYMSVVYGSKKRSRLVNTVASDLRHTTHNYNYPAGTNVQYYSRAILSDGRQGPKVFTPVIPLPITHVLFTDYNTGYLSGIQAIPFKQTFSIPTVYAPTQQRTALEFVTVDDNYIFVTDGLFKTVMKFDKHTLEYLDMYDGPNGAPGETFNNPRGVCSDGTHIYLAADTGKLFKILISNMSFVSKLDDLGEDPPHIWGPSGICCDDTYIYFTTFNQPGIRKHLKSDLSYFSSIVGIGCGNDKFNNPQGIRISNGTLYLADAENARIKLHSAADLSYISSFGPAITGTINLDNPTDIDFDESFYYIADYDNLRILSVKKSNMTFYGEIHRLPRDPALNRTVQGIAVWHE